jgi:hypoxanthine phosphoribosyltransferase
MRVEMAKSTARSSRASTAAGKGRVRQRSAGAEDGRAARKKKAERESGSARTRSRVRRATAPKSQLRRSTQAASVQFAHESEAEFAHILDFYGISWVYEPRSFVLRREDDRVVEAFTPDFFLPDLNLYIELTTMRQRLATEKNRKVRQLRELYPEVNVRLLNKRDYLSLLAKYGYGPPEAKKLPDIERVLITPSQLERRIGELGAQISRDYSGRAPVLVGVLKGVLCFMADLMRHMSLPVSVDFMSISSYEGDSKGAVKIIKDLDQGITEQHVLLVEDIVDTGMTLNRVLEHLWSRRPASLKVCALLDKRARRLVDVPLDYVGFEIPDEFVIGYGLDYRQRYRNLPFVGVLKPELLS